MTTTDSDFDFRVVTDGMSDFRRVDAVETIPLSRDAEGVIRFPPAVSRLNANNALIIVSFDPKPNAWYRFWQRVLLGWRWEDVKRE